MFIKCLQNNLTFEACPTWVSSKLTDGCLDMAKGKSLYVSPTGGLWRLSRTVPLFRVDEWEN